MMKVYYHPDCLMHDTGPGHPECPGRAETIYAALQNAEISSALEFVTPPLATDAQILLAHSEDHLQDIIRRQPLQGRVALDPDTALSPGSLSAVRHCIGSACQGIDDLMGEQTKNVFCLGRPPGHHATYDTAMGFCLLNQIAIAALYAQQHYGLERIAIVDFDVHHGNGTQDIVLRHEGLHYLSTHQSPFYPGSGDASENVPDKITNIPLAAGTDDKQYRTIFTDQLLPVLNAYKPQLLLISAGFDAHTADPLANIELNEESYYWLGQQLKTIAEQHCEGRLLSVLEGGYNLGVLGDSVKAYLRGILNR